MSAQILLEDLTDIGVKLWVESTKLKAAPASRIPPEYVHAIRSHKAELMALLGATDTLMTDGATASNQVIGEYDQGVAVLARLAHRYGHPPSDLLNYFRDDIADFATDPYAAEVIQLYIEHRAASWLLSERRYEYKPIIASDQSKPVLLAKAKPLVVTAE